MGFKAHYIKSINPAKTLGDIFFKFFFFFKQGFLPWYFYDNFINKNQPDDHADSPKQKPKAS